MIKRIKICDFKSIRGELELDLDPVTVLVGRSGTGKSNLVQAIRFLRNILLNQSAAIEYEGGWNHLVPVGEKNPRSGVEVSFSLPGYERDCTYGFACGTQGQGHGAATMRFKFERLIWDGEVTFSRSWSPTGWKWEKAPDTVVTLPNPDGPVLGQLPSLQKAVVAYAALSSGIGFYHFPSDALMNANRTRNRLQIPGGSIHPGNPNQHFLKTIPGLSDDAGNYLEVMRGITQDFHNPQLRTSLLATLKAVNPAIESVELDSLTDPTRALVGHPAAGRIFELSLEQESDGFRRFYAHMLALYQTPPKLLSVFEEPENAIFPGALSLLADEFKSAPGEHRGQVILTTHSPILLDSFDVENVRAVEMRDGKTVVGPVSKEQRDAVKDQLLTTGELLTVDQPRVDNGIQTPQAA